MQDRFGSKAAARAHVEGARKIISLRGGFSAFRSNPGLQLHLCWTDLIHLTNHEATIFEPVFAANEKTLQDRYHTDAQEELQMSVQNFQALALHRQQNVRCISGEGEGRRLPQLQTLSLDPSLLGVSAAFRIFQPSGALHAILLGPIAIKPGFSDATLVTDHARLVILLYLHAALWDTRHDRLAQEAYFLWLEKAMRENDLDGREGGGTIAVLLWLLLTGGRGGQLDDQERTEWVVRMMQVARRAGREEWEALRRDLVEALFWGDGEAGGRVLGSAEDLESERQ